MGLYDEEEVEEEEIDLEVPKKKKNKPLKVKKNKVRIPSIDLARYRTPMLYVAAVVLIVALMASLLFVYEPSPLSVSFDDGKIKSGEETVMTVSVKNILDKDLRNVLVSASPIEDTSITVTPRDQNISIISSKGIQDLDFMVRANSNANSGKYSIEVKIFLDQQMYADRAMIKVVKE